MTGMMIRRYNTVKILAMMLTATCLQRQNSHQASTALNAGPAAAN